MIINYQADSNVGCVREGNEDMILIDHQLLRDNSASGQCTRCAIVADGMGGNNAGEMASELACQAFEAWLDVLPEGLDNESLKSAVNIFVERTHALINERGKSNPEFEGMGTTLVGVFLYGGKSWWINIGDSRLYRYRNKQLQQVSTDHSMRNLYNDPTLPSNLIYNCLGSGEEYDSFADLNLLDFQPNDRFLICSDGLSDMISDEDINLLMRRNSPVSRYISSARAAGGKDNISVILFNIDE